MEICLGSDPTAAWFKLIRAMNVECELKNAIDKMKTALLNNMVDSDDEDD